MYTPKDDLGLRTAAKPFWVTPTLTSLTNVGGGYQGVRYTRMRDGMVELQGWATIGANVLTTAFTFEAGYRPATNQVFGVVGILAGTYSVFSVEVLNSGAFRFPAGQNGKSVYLNGIHFPAEA